MSTRCFLIDAPHYIKLHRNQQVENIYSRLFSQIHVYGNAWTSKTGCYGPWSFIKWTMWTPQSSQWTAEVFVCWPEVVLWTGRHLVVTFCTATSSDGTLSQLYERKRRDGIIEDDFMLCLIQNHQQKPKNKKRGRKSNNKHCINNSLLIITDQNLRVPRKRIYLHININK